MKVVWAPAALANLAELQDWLAKNVDPHTSVQQVERIRAATRRLTWFPERKPVLLGDTRYTHVKRTSFVIVYRVLDQQVQILRIRHNRENWRKG